MKPKAYQFWLEHNGQKLLLPVSPETLNVKRGAVNKTVNIAGLGDITIMQNAGLSEISFSSIFPAKYFSGCSSKKPVSPGAGIKFLIAAYGSKKPVRMTITGCKIVKYVTLESFSYSESGGDAGTYSYSVTLKGYRSTKVRQINLSKNKKAKAKKSTPPRTNNKTVPKTYTIKSGDCLWDIAKKFYGDGNKWQKIYDANKKVIGANPNIIKPGKKLTIP